MIGFGALSSGGSSPLTLKHVELAYVPKDDCNVMYNGQITEYMMCAADPGQDSCQGDSGKFMKIITVMLLFFNGFYLFLERNTSSKY